MPRLEISALALLSARTLAEAAQAEAANSEEKA